MRIAPALLPLVVTVAACSTPKPAETPHEAAPATAKPDGAPTKTDEAPTKTDDAPTKTDDAALAEAPATAEVGRPAPGFSLTDLDGKTHALSQYAGKLVVLEWFNPQCPFVNYAHTKGPLVDLATKETAAGVVWLAINSGGPGKQGHGVEANRAGVETFSLTHPVLLDETGEVGRRYGAVKTPHLFVIDEQGVLRYAGGIDNAPFGEVDGDAEPRGHLVEALADVRAGKDVRVPTAPAWGCTVKYAS